MQEAPLPYNETQRLASLHNYHVLDTTADREFQMIVEQAAAVCNVPIALINFIDKDRGWFYAKSGTEEVEVPRNKTFCAHAILQRDAFIITDTRTDKASLIIHLLPVNHL
ncbi:MAG: hypothetical protein A2W76_09565 [Gammaproteobacteria bacterium RIFCSPLOWO2_12_47_11]|nr:MAG: hypothetical protein A2W76_09565 [Gammaproteobacteria bacterium RIFCSPLOWO2_12_47_11]OGT84993.1 MAG: hypothetical protein A3G42_03555 [Gammaproteobacteria bacterium RIFCSPLOWO2_12_FULL_47_76]